MSPSKRRRPSSHLVSHDVHYERDDGPTGRKRVLATIQCERRGCSQPIDECRACERFERIEAHEAGYVLLCRSSDESFDTDE